MPTAFLRFYAELNDFLPADRRYVESPYSLDEPIRGSGPITRGRPHAGSSRGGVDREGAAPTWGSSPTVREGAAHLTDFTNQEFENTKVSVQEIIESLGVPHTEVDLILVNGESVDFSHIVRNGERISIYPVFEALNITPLVRLRPHPLRQLRFVLDRDLDKLATHLRSLGFDALTLSNTQLEIGDRDVTLSTQLEIGDRDHYEDETLIQISLSERRILLTRNRALLKHKELTHVYCVHSADPEQQLREVIERFDLSEGL
jgi:Mut7-C ubiquitin/Mut7-C RNAse domain